MNRKEMRRLPNAGFTLIEILLVVVIIGMLASIVTVSIPKHMEKARQSKARADIDSLGVAISSYYMEVGKYPPSLDALTQGNDPYLEKAIPADPWGGQYQYNFPGTHPPFKYDLRSLGGDGTESADDVSNWQTDQKK